jgi:hypothetical protein
MYFGVPRVPLTAQGVIAVGPACKMTVVLTAGAAAATATIREGGAGGADVLLLAAAANTSSAPVTMNIRDPFLQAIAGAGATLNVTL